MVSGEVKAAHLFDTSYAPAFDPVFLGLGVNDVQFQVDEQARLTGIMTVLDDGVFHLYDPNGKPTAQIVFSPDRTRKVEISGDEKEAYLFSAAEPADLSPVFLGFRVAGVQFQWDAAGQLVVVVRNEDGSVNSYNRSGILIDSQPAQLSSAAVSAEPASAMGKSLEKSAAFTALQSGSLSW